MRRPIETDAFSFWDPQMNALRYSALSVIILAWAVAVFMGVSAAVLQSFGTADDNTSAAPAAEPAPAAPAPGASGVGHVGAALACCILCTAGAAA